ncbi:MAG: hypothetical protein EKK41_17405 [Hyphomicrobiales bacterium]|nr:MAG: hypothetical protein EKK41_17405 [Hyphomicrobiales bacterium]
MNRHFSAGAAAVVILIGALAATALRSAAQSPASADRPVSLAAFDTVARVLTHPRCQNCHTQTGYPRQGDDRHPHAMNVQRGSDGHGAAGQRCTACHGRANNSASGVPGADEDWHLAPLSMGWEGRTPRELCLGLKDPARNGGRTGAKIIEHFDTPLVRWGWNPGRRADGTLRAVPPVAYAAFVTAAKRWLETGAACPD